MNNFVMNLHSRETDRAIRNGRGPSELEVQRQKERNLRETLMASILEKWGALVGSVATDLDYAITQLEPLTKEPLGFDRVRRTMDALERCKEAVGRMSDGRSS